MNPHPLPRAGREWRSVAELSNRREVGNRPNPAMTWKNLRFSAASNRRSIRRAIAFAGLPITRALTFHHNAGNQNLGFWL